MCLEFRHFRSLGVATLTLALALILGACSEAPKALRGEPLVKKGYVLGDELPAFKLDCKSGDCPGYVVAIHSTLESGLALSCTGFLVAANVVMTDSHCIDQGDLDAYCRGTQVHGLYEDVPVTARCSKVLLSHAVSGRPEEDDKDYAFLQIDAELMMKPLELNSKVGVQHGESYKVWSVDFHGVNSGTIVDMSCRAIQRSILLPHFRTDHSAMSIYVDCPVVMGFSGSPVVSADGEGVAIITAGLSQEEADQHFFLRGRRVAIGVNMSCVDFPSITGLSYETCRPENIFDARREAFRQFYTDLDVSAESLVNDWQKKIRRHRWAPMSVKPFVWMPVPKCISRSYHLVWQLQLPLWELNSLVDGDLNLSFRYSPPRYRTYSLVLYPDQSKNNEEFAFTIAGEDGVMAQGFAPACSAQD